MSKLQNIVIHAQRQSKYAILNSNVTFNLLYQFKRISYLQFIYFGYSNVTLTFLLKAPHEEEEVVVVVVVVEKELEDKFAEEEVEANEEKIEEKTVAFN